MYKLEKIIKWANGKENISALVLTGSLASHGLVDNLSDYDIAVYGKSFDFIKTDKWLEEIEDHLVCVHDKFRFYDFEIPTRLTIFDPYFKVDFSFHSRELLNKIIDSDTLPDEYNIGYKVLLDKHGLAAKLAKPTFRGFIIKKPDEHEFKKNVDEFWFEVYHIVKYLSRGDLWTAMIRDRSAKEFLLQMLQWHKAAHENWNISLKNFGKEMKTWLDKSLWNELSQCFAKFNTEDSWKALENTIMLYQKLARETAAYLQYTYNEKLDKSISNFIQTIKLI